MKKIDKPLLITMIILIILGIVMIYSASFIWAQYKYHDAFKFVKAQSIFFFMGLILIFIFSNIPSSFWYKQANKIVFICFLLLILVLIPGIGTIRNGSRSWFGIGSLGIQPSEFSKLGLIIFVSRYLAKNKKDIKDIKKSIFPLLGFIMLFFILIMLEPDFGTSMVIVLSLISLIFVSGVSLSFFVKIGILGLLGIIILIIIAPYRIARITSFINPWSDPLGSGFQIIQSLYAIGPGGLLGQGFLNSRQNHFYLPEPQTDFIFAIISEEFGFLGVLIITTLFFFLYYRSLKIALRSYDLFDKFLVFGLANSILIQATLNIAIIIGILPVTGITLPFISYGGSSLLVSMISIGIILGVSKK